MRIPLAFCLTLGLAAPAAAALAQADLDAVALAPPPGARLPLDAPLRDETGAPTTLRGVLDGRAAGLLAFAYYTCESVCGTEIALASASLADPKVARLGIPLVVVGLDPKDGPEAAAAMRAASVPEAPQTRFLTAEARSVEALTAAAGFGFRYDRERDQFAHPAALLTLTADGHVGRALAGLSLGPDTLRRALVEASDGRAGTLFERIALRCYAFDPATGLYTADIRTLLRWLAGATLLALGLAILALLRRPPAGAAR